MPLLCNNCSFIVYVVKNMFEKSEPKAKNNRNSFFTPLTSHIHNDLLVERPSNPTFEVESRTNHSFKSDCNKLNPLLHRSGFPNPFDKQNNMVEQHLPIKRAANPTGEVESRTHHSFKSDCKKLDALLRNGSLSNPFDKQRIMGLQYSQIEKPVNPAHEVEAQTFNYFQNEINPNGDFTHQFVEGQNDMDTDVDMDELFETEGSLNLGNG